MTTAGARGEDPPRLAAPFPLPLVDIDPICNVNFNPSDLTTAVYI